MKKSFKGNEDTRIWCEYCRIFVYNNRINREKHDASPQHQANFKKKVETLRREEEEKKKLLPRLADPVSTNKSFYQSTTLTVNKNSESHVNNLSMKNTIKTTEKKAVLGLAKEPKELVNHASQTSESAPFEADSKSMPLNVDIKSTAAELKRKMKEDEKSLIEKTEEQEISDSQVCAEEVLSLFKKKKSK